MAHMYFAGWDYLEGQEDLASGLKMWIAGVTEWFIGVVGILPRPPDPPSSLSKERLSVLLVFCWGSGKLTAHLGTPMIRNTTYSGVYIGHPIHGNAPVWLVDLDPKL